MAAPLQVDPKQAGPDTGAHPILNMLRRFFPIYCALAAVVTFGYALYDAFQIDGDAVAYMDIGDYLRAHRWGGIINGYWHPMYPAFLSLGHALLHPSLATEMRAYYLVNFGIFLLEMVAMVAIADAIAGSRFEVQGSRWLLDRYGMRYLGLGLLVIASQRELSLGKVRPDALLQAFLLLAVTALLRHVATGKVRWAAAMGLALGCAYLTKSFAFVFALLCVAAVFVLRWIWMRAALPRVVAGASVALVCFGVVAGPYVAALSRQHGRLDFGDSGSLNYAWYVGGTEKMHLQPYMTDRFASADVHLKHPEKELLRSPQVLSYAALPYGTYPDWFDTTYWNDQVKPHFNWKGEVSRAVRNCVLVVRYLCNHPEALVLLALLLAMGARMGLEWRPTSLRDVGRPAGGDVYWLAPLGLGVLIWGIYATVNTEERYVTVAFLMIVLAVFATLRAPEERADWLRLVAGATVLLLALLAVGQSLREVAEDRRQLSIRGIPGGWYSPSQEHAAEALKSMGLGPGDAVACVGSVACLEDPYWARLAQVRILDEIYDPMAAPAWEFLDSLPNRDEAIAAVKAQGAKVLVADFGGAPLDETKLAAEGWQQLGDSTLYELPLNLAPGTVPKKAAPPVRHRPSV